MTYGVIGDIHGNLYALEAILSALKNQGISQVIVAGDLIADCNYPNEVLNLIRSLNGFVIKGNREEYVLEYLEDKHPEWDGLHQMSSVVWTAHELTADNIAYLKQLPAQLTIALENDSIISVVHGSPFDINEHLYEDKNQERLREAVDFVNSEVLICAHSHKPWKKMMNHTLVVNPGSAGVHFNEKSGAEYAILQFEAGKWEATHHTAGYNIEKFKASMTESSLMKVAPTWAQLIIESIEDGYNANIMFIRKIFKDYSPIGWIENEVWEKASHHWKQRKEGNN